MRMITPKLWQPAVLFLLAVSGGITLAEKVTDSNALFDMSIQELMEVPIVVTAARDSQRIDHSAIPVSIITREDIHFSGATTIPEILQFAPGIDVRRVDRSRYAVGVRGLSGLYSDRTLVLINGRDAMNPVFASIDWMHFPVLIEDIERIEIVRGPAGGVWGANAFNGVINIITTRPSDTPDNLFSTTINEYGDTYNQARVMGTKGAWRWRVSASYEDLENSDDAGAGRMVSAFPELNPFIGFSAYEARDFFRSYKIDTEVQYDISEQTALSFGGAHSQNEFGDLDNLGYFPMQDDDSSVTRLFARIDHEFDAETRGHLQWYGNYVVSHLPQVIRRYSYYLNDLEGQLDFHPVEEHKISVGGNLRWTHITTDNQSLFNEAVFSEPVFDEYGAGLFAVDHWTITDRLSLESQARIDRFNKTQTDWSLRSALLYALDSQDEHILRLAFARAYRSAAAIVRESSISSLGGMFQSSPSPDEFGNEHTYSIEAGYSGKIGDNCMLRVDGYYQRMDDFLGVETQMFGPVSISTFDNYGGADSHGVETELTYEMHPAKISAWYSYNELNTDDPAEVVRAFFPARHKAGIRLLYDFDQFWTGAVNFVYNDVIHLNEAGSPFKEASVFNRLDMTLSRSFAKGSGEWMLGVSDVLNQTEDPVFDINTFARHETPGRTFFTRLQWRF
ncbi:MAG: TonB-dependent receptor [Planctomycetaceae bacterium]|nr:TonB-dependent receptor [Planctomycetaceae bacterium]